MNKKNLDSILYHKRDDLIFFNEIKLLMYYIIINYCCKKHGQIIDTCLLFVSQKLFCSYEKGYLLVDKK